MLENFRQQALQVSLSACLLFLPAIVFARLNISLYLALCLSVSLFVSAVGPCHSRQLLGSCMLPSIVDAMMSSHWTA